jgi:uncharacterized protein YbjT (DUF2867 family)
MTAATNRPRTVLVVGSTGSVGRLVVEEAARAGYLVRALVHNVLTALSDQPARVALMTSIGITNRGGSYNRSTEGPDWKRRSERLVRASGRPYSIVRPGWFDYNAPDEQLPVFLQGDLRRSGGPSDGAISRRQIAQVLVASLGSEAAIRKTFELVAEQGEGPSDLGPLFAALGSDEPHSFDGLRDEDNMPLPDEPARVRNDLEALTAARRET